MLDLRQRLIPTPSAPALSRPSEVPSAIPSHLPTAYVTWEVLRLPTLLLNGHSRGMQAAILFRHYSLIGQVILQPLWRDPTQTEPP